MSFGNQNTVVKGIECFALGLDVCPMANVILSMAVKIKLVCLNEKYSWTSTLKKQTQTNPSNKSN